MARNRRDPRREKLLDMRRVDGGQLSDIFDKLHPEYNWKNLPLGMWRMLWAESRRAEPRRGLRVFPLFGRVIAWARELFSS